MSNYDSQFYREEDDALAAIARERAMHQEHEENAAERQTRAFNALLREKLAEDAEARDAAKRDTFRAKLAYWRSNGAPAYHGPRAVERGAINWGVIAGLLFCLIFWLFVGWWIYRHIMWAITL